MDTRSRKFDKLLLIRIVALLMALVFICFAAVRTASYIYFCEANNNTADMLFTNLFEKNSNLDEMDAFYDEYEDFTNSVLEMGLVFSQGWEKAYDDYANGLDKAYKDNILRAILGDSYVRRSFETFYCLENGYITLEKIADTVKIDPEENETENENLFFYYNGIGYFNPDIPDPVTTTNADGETDDTAENSYLNSIDLEMLDEIDGNYIIDLDSLEEIGDGNYYAIKQYKNVNYTDASAELLNKAADLNADAIVEIKNAIYGADHKEYHGYYAVKVDTQKIFKAIQQDGETAYFITLGTMLTKQSFKEGYYECKNKIGSIKNIRYYLYNRDTGAVITSESELFGLEADETTFPAIISHFIKNCGEEKLCYFTNGKAEKHSTEFIQNTSSSFYMAVSGALVVFDSIYTNEKITQNYVFLTDFDSKLSYGNDVFTDIAETNNVLKEMGKALLPVLIICALGFLMCLTALVALTGRRSYDSEIHLSGPDKLFTDFKILLNGGLVALLCYGFYILFFEYFYYFRIQVDGLYYISNFAKIIVFAIVLAVTLLVIDFILYIARHIKNRSLFTNISIIRLISYIARRIRTFSGRPQSYKNLYKGNIIRFVALFALPNLFLISIAIVYFFHDESDITLVVSIFLLIYDAVMLLLSFRYLSGVLKMLDCIHDIKQGNFENKINVNHIPKNLKNYATDLNNISDGINESIDQALKEQKMRTELITNVSHDLKTPLTSIINYADLLLNCDIKNEAAESYIEVLHNKSLKLKKLIEDLIDASKISTGNVDLHPIELNFSELIHQACYEYEDNLKEKNIEMILNGDNMSDTVIYADSQASARVIDNIMSNVEKYSMPGTRVFISLSRDDKYATVTISNISKNMLNLPAEELMQRFVRGDEARAGDGNGLGLSIAKNLMLQQNGKLDIAINGDMFTVRIDFPVAG